MKYNKPKLFYYRTAQAISWLVATFIFRRKIIRNEIKGKSGPFVVIANHEASLDFVNLIGLTNRPMTFVISNSFYNTLPVKGFLKKLAVIPKQQFQTTISDLKAMKSVINAGQPLVIYPAGLMSEDGISTPIPAATYKFLKWLNADVYAAKTSGTYFAMPKWSKGFRPGNTYLDVYKLFSKEELVNTKLSDIKQKTERALLFDAYREQEELRVKYMNNSDMNGLEHVLYMCPNCRREFSMMVKNKNTIQCTRCGFRQVSDEYAFMRKVSDIGSEIRYVSDWSRFIYNDLKAKIAKGKENVLSSTARIHMIDYKKRKFAEAGSGIITLSSDGFHIKGHINGNSTDMRISIANIPTLPFIPGRYFEIQDKSDTYRCIPDDGRLVMKYINMLKIFYELEHKPSTAEI